MIFITRNIIWWVHLGTEESRLVHYIMLQTIWYLLLVTFDKLYRQRAVFQISWRKALLRWTKCQRYWADRVCLLIFLVTRKRNCRRMCCSFSSDHFSLSYYFEQIRNPIIWYCNWCPSTSFHILCLWEQKSFWSLCKRQRSIYNGATEIVKWTGVVPGGGRVEGHLPLYHRPSLYFYVLWK